ncbi:MAG: type II toxin-antitoxin system PemK/MazF family toxin [Anditalea sp.]
MEINQYEVLLVYLDPTIGSEIKKTRPCLIISPDEINHNLQTVIVAPMATKSHKYPTRVKVKFSNQTGWVILDQVRTIDKQRVIKKLGQLGPSEINECKKILKETFVD